MPLRLRLGLVFALATAALVASVGVVFLLQLRASLDATLDADLQSRATLFLDQYRNGGVASLRLTQDEEPVQVLTVDGRVLAGSPGLGGAPVLDEATRRDVAARDRPGVPPLSFTAEDDDDSTRFLVTVLSARDGVLLVTGTDTDIADAADEHVEKGFLLLGPPTV